MNLTMRLLGYGLPHSVDKVEQKRDCFRKVLAINPRQLPTLKRRWLN